MRKIVIISTIFILLMILEAYQINIGWHKRNRDMAKFAFETGCYQNAKMSCNIMKNSHQRYLCYEKSLTNCPIMAKLFSDWITNGK